MMNYNHVLSKEVCIYLIFTTNDYFLHHKLLMISKQYYLHSKDNIEYEYSLICQFQHVEYTKSLGKLVKTYKVSDIIHRIKKDKPAVIQYYKTSRGYKKRKEWYVNGNLHRFNDLPSEVNIHFRVWYKHGELHRDNDKPAMEYTDGRKEWWVDGEPHRDNNLPSCVDIDCKGREWYVKGVLHRTDGGVTEILSDGTMNWHVNGKLHRDNDLPAVIESNGIRR